MPTLSSLCLRKQKNGAIDLKSVHTNARVAQTGLSLFFLGIFGLLAAKMVVCAMRAPGLPMLATAASTPPQFAKARPDIVDRNGRLLATDIRAYWLYANPEQLRNTIGADEAAEKIATLFKDIDAPALSKRFRTTKGTFEWVKRGLTPRQAEAVHNLGIPGFYLVTAPQRVYPAGNEAAHILGVTSVDNSGLAGVEKYIDAKLGNQVEGGSLAERPIVKLSIDLGIQHALTEELVQAKEKYKAQAVMGLLLDVTNGEVLASASLPDFDPNRREGAFEEPRQNRIVSDNYELGSVFKSFTIAMALDEGLVTRADRIDAATPLKSGKFTLTDHHASRAPMSIDDIFIHSSNTGAARVAMLGGVLRQRAFLQKLGLFQAIDTEAGSSPQPMVPKIWRPTNAITISYGHGIAVPPLVFASAAATLVNGGERIKPTFLISAKAEDEKGDQLIKPETSAALRDMMRLTVLRGTGKRAAVPGLAVGGKTGTAWKVKNGQYSSDVMNSFVAAFPIDKPKYLLLVTLDEPKPEKPGALNEAAYNAAPTAGAIIGRVAPMLNILPTARFDEAASTSYEQTQLPVRDPSPLSRNARDEVGRPRQKYSVFGQPASGIADPRNSRVN